MNDHEPPNRRPFRRCLETWHEEMGNEKIVHLMSVPDAWFKTKPGLPYPWNGAFFKWQRDFKDEPQ